MRALTIILFIALFLTACEDGTEDTSKSEVDSLGNTEENIDIEVGSDKIELKEYENEAFKAVTVQKTGEDQYLVKGKARVFEATINWVVEDGHNELKTGYATASEGAPGWGDFEFIVEVQKQEPQTHLMLILFEESAKDGSRQHELIIPLREATPA